ncbi:TetR/AcrR family transcriptional regulator [Ruegeria sp. HKCCD7221]|uniref:TetR/AcrR family transcriptional regulator n=1 Tax=Ruegeria sp. HKCCD7221 TaxID=2683009 RepID=UPI00148955CF|nr:TetR/AcrR family transcriptional regulator [Ruegeria sp. HKCCD7221]
MGYSQAQKERHREEILSNAGEQLRSGGFSAINVVSLMNSVGLTHGGFYGHFENKEDLLDQALERALREGRLTQKLNASPNKPSFARYIGSYVSPKHRDLKSSGCAIPALVSDVSRRPKASRDIMQSHIDGFINTVADYLDGDRSKANLAVAAMVGSIALSRVMTDDAKASEMLKATKAYLLTLEDDEEQG